MEWTLIKEENDPLWNLKAKWLQSKKISVKANVKEDI